MPSNFELREPRIKFGQRRIFGNKGRIDYALSCGYRPKSALGRIYMWLFLNVRLSLTSTKFELPENLNNALLSLEHQIGQIRGLFGFSGAVRNRWIVQVSNFEDARYFLKVGGIDDTQLLSEISILSNLRISRPSIRNHLPEVLPLDEHGAAALVTKFVESVRPVAYKDILEIAIDLHNWKIVHGDFTPWNVKLTSTGYVLLDWEYAPEEYRVGTDVVHYLVKESSLLLRQTPEACIRKVLQDGGLLHQYIRSIKSKTSLESVVREYLVSGANHDESEFARNYRSKMLEHLQQQTSNEKWR